MLLVYVNMHQIIWKYYIYLCVFFTFGNWEWQGPKGPVWQDDSKLFSFFSNQAKKNKVNKKNKPLKNLHQKFFKFCVKDLKLLIIEETAGPMIKSFKMSNTLISINTYLITKVSLSISISPKGRIKFYPTLTTTTDLYR